MVHMDKNHKENNHNTCELTSLDNVLIIKYDKSPFVV